MDSSSGSSVLGTVVGAFVVGARLVVTVLATTIDVDVVTGLSRTTVVDETATVEVDVVTGLSRTTVVGETTTSDVDVAEEPSKSIATRVPEKRLPTSDTARPPSRNPASERSGNGASATARPTGGEVSL